MPKYITGHLGVRMFLIFLQFGSKKDPQKTHLGERKDPKGYIGVKKLPLAIFVTIEITYFGHPATY